VLMRPVPPTMSAFNMPRRYQTGRTTRARHVPTTADVGLASPSFIATRSAMMSANASRNALATDAFFVGFMRRAVARRSRRWTDAGTLRSTRARSSKPIKCSCKGLSWTQTRKLLVAQGPIAHLLRPRGSLSAIGTRSPGVSSGRASRPHARFQLKTRFGESGTSRRESRSRRGRGHRRRERSAPPRRARWRSAR